MAIPSSEMVRRKMCCRRKGSGGVGLRLPEHEPAVSSDGQEGQYHPGLYQE